MPLVMMGPIMGRHVRVEPEDSPSLSRGEVAMSCDGRVSKIWHILTELSLDIASPADCRTILRLKGASG